MSFKKNSRMCQIPLLFLFLRIFVPKFEKCCPNSLNCYALLYYLYFALLMYLLLVPCILASHTNKLKKWILYIYLLTTITKALYQSSEKGMSLLFTCPQLTAEESSLLVATVRMRLHAACCMLHTLYNFYQIESIPQFLKLWPISMHFDRTLILLYFIEMLPHMVSSSLI